MATQLVWYPLDLERGYFASPVSIDLTTTPTSEFRVATIPQNFDKPVRAQKVLIDNLANNGIVTFQYGPFTFSVVQFSRSEFPIPRNFDAVKISGSVGTVKVIFSSDASLAQQDVNQLLIGQAGAMGMSYNYVGLTADYSVTANDGGKFFEMIGGPVAPKNFNLPGIAANQIPNGFVVGIKNASTLFPVLVNPNGTDKINSYFDNSAHVLVINTNSVAYLLCTGGAWKLVNTRLLTSVASMATTVGTVAFATHDLLTTGEKFDDMPVELVCDAANNNYVVGDRVIAPQSLYVVVDQFNAGSIKLVNDSATIAVLKNRATGVSFNALAANWHFEFWGVKYYN